jgi:hypothetical protein
MKVADDSYEWYKSRAIICRRSYRIAATGILLMSAAIPASVAISPTMTSITALLGASVAVVSGLDSIFHWQDNYLRYSLAREAVDAQCRLYKTQQGAYSDEAYRDEVLVREVTRIEQAEMGAWLRIASPRSDR